MFLAYISRINIAKNIATEGKLEHPKYVQLNSSSFSVIIHLSLIPLRFRPPVLPVKLPLDDLQPTNLLLLPLQLIIQ